MRICKYCQSELDASASFCGFCGQTTSVTTDEHTRHCDAVHTGLDVLGENSTFISPSNPGQVRSQQIHTEHSSNDVPYWSNAPYGNPGSQESTALVRPLINFTQNSGPAASVQPPIVRRTPPPPVDRVRTSGATSTADRLIHEAQAHQYPQQAVRLNPMATPVNHQGPTAPSSAAPRSSKDHKGHRSPGRAIAISLLLLAIAIVTPLFYMLVTHASSSNLVGLKNCPGMPSAAKISLGPVVEGQSQPVSTPFTLCTQGTGTVSWTSSWDQQQAPWLQIDHTSGQVAASQTQQINVSAAAKDLKAGTYSTPITFSDENKTNVLLNVTLDVQKAPPNPSCISIDPATLKFTATATQGSPAAQKVSVKNCGQDAGQWSVKTSAAWLTLDSNGALLNSGVAQDVNVSVDSTNLKPGSYTGQVIFTLGTQQKTLNVALNVDAIPTPTPTNTPTPTSTPTPAPCLQGSATLNFTAVVQQGNPPAQSVQLKNPCGPGNWKATSSDSSWLNATPASGQLSGNDLFNVSIAVTSSGLSANTYNGTVTFSDGTKKATVNVTLTVQSPPACIKNLSPASLIFNVTQGSSTLPQQVTFGNPCGAGKWSASSDSAWLSATPNSGTLSGRDTVAANIAVDVSNLSQGTYSGNVAFSDGTNTVTVSVKLTVQSTPTPTPTSPSP